jgi:hypothetical protein
MKEEKERAQVENKQRCGKAFQENGKRENQTTESLCQPSPLQEISKAEEVSPGGDSRSQDKRTGNQEADPLCVILSRPVRAIALNSKRSG